MYGGSGEKGYFLVHVCYTAILLVIGNELEWFSPSQSVLPMIMIGRKPPFLYLNCQAFPSFFSSAVLLRSDRELDEDMVAS